MKKLFFLILLSFAGFSQTHLSASQFIAKANSTKNAQWLDVRTPAEWQAGKLKNSHCIDFTGVTFKQEIEKLDKNKPVFVFCAAGGRSTKASKILKEAGFKEIYNLQNGGYQDLINKK